MSAEEFSQRVTEGWQSVRGARHSARLPGYLASATLLVFFLLGIRSAFFSGPAASPAAPPQATADAPSQDFALQFARAYLTYDAARPGLRVRALAPYIGGAGLEPGAGLSPSRGRQSVRWVEVASDQPALAGGRLITVAASVSTQRLPLYLAVTVEHPRGRPLSLGGYPSLVGAPLIAPPATPPQREAVTDPALTQVVDRVLRNYLAGAGPDLEADLSPGAQVSLPTRRLRLREVSELLWLGARGSGAVLATVTAGDPAGATYTLSSTNSASPTATALTSTSLRSSPPPADPTNGGPHAPPHRPMSHLLSPAPRPRRPRSLRLRRARVLAGRRGCGQQVPRRRRWGRGQRAGRRQPPRRPAHGLGRCRCSPSSPAAS